MDVGEIGDTADVAACEGDRRLGLRVVGDRERLLSSGEVARELGVSRSAVLKWTTGTEERPAILTPAVTTPGGHHRYYLSEVLEQLRAARQRGDQT